MLFSLAVWSIKIQLLAKQQKKLTRKSCNLLKNRSKDYFICGSCKTYIDKDKIPKRSHKHTFKYANLPTKAKR